MFASGKQQRSRAQSGDLVAILAVALALVGVQVALLVTLVATPLDRAVVAAREPSPAMVLVRVPEYAEEIEVVGPPRWQRDLARAGAWRRESPRWLAGVQADEAAPLVCPVTR